MKCVWWPSGPRDAASRARASQSSSSVSPAPASGGRRARRSRAHPGAAPGARRTPPRPGRRAVVRRGRRPRRTVPGSWAASRNAYHARAVALVAAAAALPRLARARDRAGRHPRGVRREERHVRADARRERDVRVPARGLVRVHAAALRLVPGRRSTGRSSARGSSSASRRSPLAVATALLVLAIGRHSRLGPDRRDRGARRDAAPVPRLARRPRQSRDRRRAPARRDRARSRCSPTTAARTWLAIAAGAVTGLAILSNARLLLLPLVVAPFAAWRIRPGRRAVGRRRCWSWRPRLLVVAPWVARNQVGDRLRDDHDGHARALEGEQPRDVRRPRARVAGSTTCPSCPAFRRGRRRRPRSRSRRRRPSTSARRRRFYRDEVLDFWRDEPGEKARLAGPGGRDAVVAVPERRGGRRRPAGRSRPRAADGRAGLRARALRARALGRLPGAAPIRRRSPRCCSATTR